MALKQHPLMPLDYKSNGCGADKARFDFVPDTIYGASIFEACRRHDFRYELGGTEEDKEIADLEFLHNMLVIVNSVESWYYPTKLARIRVIDYYSAVEDYGDGSFNFKE